MARDSTGPVMWWSRAVIVLPIEIAAQMETLGLRMDHPVSVWDGPPDPAPTGCRFYVPAYMAGEWAMIAMADMPLLEVCQLPTAGYEHALMHLPPGVTLCNAAGVHDASTAELAVALILARLRRLDDGARAMSSGQFLHGRFESLADKHVVVIGAGGIGQALARRLEGFECHVTLVARTSRDGVRSRAELPDLLPVADVVVLAVPLDETTRGLVDASFLRRMKDGSLLVNIARGAIADTDALLAETGRLQFALDVTDPEPLPPDHPLWRSSGVLISPHIGGNTSAFLPRVARLVAEQARRWISGQSALNVVVS